MAEAAAVVASREVGWRSGLVEEENRPVEKPKDDSADNPSAALYKVVVGGDSRRISAATLNSRFEFMEVAPMVSWLGALLPPGIFCCPLGRLSTAPKRRLWALIAP